MSRARIYLRNIGANWVGNGATLLIMFFTTPFVLSMLGLERYGLWALLMSLTGYLGLIDIGTRAGLGRYINYYLGRKEADKANGIINTALGIFAAAGVTLLIASSVISVFLPVLFPKIPPELMLTARLVVFCIAANLWLSFLHAAFRTILTCYERFDLANVVELAVVVLRTAGVIGVLLAGHGLLAMGVVHVAGGVVGFAAAYMLGRRIHPDLRLSWRLISRERFRELFGFSIWAFVGSIGMKLLYATDKILIGVVLGPGLVGIYHIGGQLLFKGRLVVGHASSVFHPRLIQQCAREDWQGVRDLIRRSSDVTMLVTIPLFTGLILFGREFIELWMPAGFDHHTSYRVLMILSLSQFFALAAAPVMALFPALNRVRLGASLTLMQGVVNLGLSLLFVLGLGWGLEGVAWGTFYPMVGFSVVGWLVAARMVQLDVAGFCWTHVLRWAAAVGLYAAVCSAINLLPMDVSWHGWAIKALLAAVAFPPVAWAVLIRGEDRSRAVGIARRAARRAADAAGSVGRAAIGRGRNMQPRSTTTARRP